MKTRRILISIFAVLSLLSVSDVNAIDYPFRETREKAAAAKKKAIDATRKAAVTAKEKAEILKLLMDPKFVQDIVYSLAAYTKERAETLILSLGPYLAASEKERDFYLIDMDLEESTTRENVRRICNVGCNRITCNVDFKIPKYEIPKGSAAAINLSCKRLCPRYAIKHCLEKL